MAFINRRGGEKEGSRERPLSVSSPCFQADREALRRRSAPSSGDFGRPKGKKNTSSPTHLGRTRVHVNRLSSAALKKTAYVASLKEACDRRRLRLPDDQISVDRDTSRRTMECADGQDGGPTARELNLADGHPPIKLSIPSWPENCRSAMH
jgi:hypothetical protein